jgi:hypothetical protein
MCRKLPTRFKETSFALVGRITIKERISKHHSGLVGAPGPTIPTE